MVVSGLKPRNFARQTIIFEGFGETRTQVDEVCNQRSWPLNLALAACTALDNQIFIISTSCSSITG